MFPAFRGAAIALVQGVMSDEPKGRWQEVEAWPEPVDGRLLLNELAQALRQLVILPKWAPEALALWIVHTYAFLLRRVSAYSELSRRRSNAEKRR